LKTLWVPVLKRFRTCGARACQKRPGVHRPSAKLTWTLNGRPALGKKIPAGCTVQQLRLARRFGEPVLRAYLASSNFNSSRLCAAHSSANGWSPGLRLSRPWSLRILAMVTAGTLQKTLTQRRQDAKPQRFLNFWIAATTSPFGYLNHCGTETQSFGTGQGI